VVAESTFELGGVDDGSRLTPDRRIGTDPPSWGWEGAVGGGLGRDSSSAWCGGRADQGGLPLI